MTRIKIQDLLPLMKPGFVAMDSNGVWVWYKLKPRVGRFCPEWLPAAIAEEGCVMVLCGLDIAPFEGDWEDSLMKCGNIHDGGTK